MIDIKSIENCNGCKACMNICPRGCITQEVQSDGFLYPVVNLSNCIECAYCIKVCPIINKPECLCIPKGIACYNKDENVRKKSTSGAIFPLLAQYIIDKGGVVFGACYDENFDVYHDYAQTMDGAEKFKGSKYVQSDTGFSFRKVRDFLGEGRYVLFSGTPCQIGGLRSFLGEDYNNLLCVDLACHGVPSPKVWRKYLEFLISKAEGDLISVNQRNKEESWKRYSVALDFDNGKKYRKTIHDDMMMKAFLSDIALRKSCYDCNFKDIERVADITLADCWGVEKIAPKFDDDKGTSLLIIHSNKGKMVFEEISEKIMFEEIDLEKACLFNPSLVKSSVRPAKREEFFEEIEIENFKTIIDKYCEIKDNRSFMTRLKQKFM